MTVPYPSSLDPKSVMWREPTRPAPSPKPTFTVEITYDMSTEIYDDVTDLQYPSTKPYLVLHRSNGTGFTYPWDRVRALDVTANASQ